MTSRRRIFVPGKPLGVNVIVSDALRSVVLAVPHEGEVIVVFVGSDPRARAMTPAEAKKFKHDLKWIHQAIVDDEKIAQMELEFKKESPDE
jgi:hypothetical protein